MTAILTKAIDLLHYGSNALGHDHRLKAAIQDVMQTIGAEHLLATPLSVPRDPRDGAEVADPGLWILNRGDRVDADIVRSFRDLRKSPPIREDRDSTRSLWLARTPDAAFSLYFRRLGQDEYWWRDPRQRTAMSRYGVFVHFANPRRHRFSERFNRLEHGGAPVDAAWEELLHIAGLVEAMLIKRDQAYSFMPEPFRRLTWQGPAGSQEARIALPWVAEAAQPTITLSLDLRRSTFAMREATDRKKFAHWIDALTHVLRAIAHDNLAIFDKFTGDGVIVHFLPEAIAQTTEVETEQWRIAGFLRPAEKGEPPGPGPLARAWERAARTSGGDRGERNTAFAALLALRCAREMIAAVEFHLEHIRPHLQFWNQHFGASVGLGEGEAVWSLDGDGRPIVVGAGVVTACRLNGLPAGAIQMPNDLGMLLARFGDQVTLTQSEIANRDYGRGQGAMGWTVGGVDPDLTRPAPEIRQIVDMFWRHRSGTNGAVG